MNESVFGKNRYSYQALEALEGGQGKPTFKFYSQGGNPRCALYMNRNDQSIIGNMGETQLNQLLGCLELLVRNPEPRKYSIDLLHTYDNEGEKHDKPIHRCTLWCGRDKKGVIFVTLTVPNGDYPHVQVPLVESFWSNTKYGDGSDIPMSEQSEIQTLGLLRSLPTLMSVDQQQSANKAAGGNQGQGGGYQQGGGYNKGGYQKGGYNKGQGGGYQQGGGYNKGGYQKGGYNKGGYNGGGYNKGGNGGYNGGGYQKNNYNQGQNGGGYQKPQQQEPQERFSGDDWPDD